MIYCLQTVSGGGKKRRRVCGRPVTVFMGTAEVPTCEQCAKKFPTNVRRSAGHLPFLRRPEKIKERE